MMNRSNAQSITTGSGDADIVMGQMMPCPPNIPSLLEYAAHHHSTQRIISRRLEGDIHSYSYRDAYRRVCQLANALHTLGVKVGDRIGTLAWNGYRHFECYYAISGIGAICHTINPRLYGEQIEYIIRHAEDEYLFVDACFLNLLTPILPQLSSVKGIIVLIDESHMPDTHDLIKASKQSSFIVLNYEALLNGAGSDFNWPTLPPDTAACLCYTSGTTGNPKGVLYSHFSTVMHAYASRNPDALNVSADTVVMPVVPMYHVCAWGMPYIAAMAGATLVLPGDGMDGPALYELIEYAKVELMLGVPTVWLRLLEYLEENHLQIPSVKTVGVGGAASPKALVEALDKQHGIYLLPIWGMTETSPLATLGARTKAMENMSDDERYHIQTTAGKPMFGIEIEIFDDNNHVVTHDGKSRGFLRVRGPWVLRDYYKTDKANAFIEDAHGNEWFDTGDIAVIDENSYLKIVDRAKDVVKSGGEWISSIDLENAALEHESVSEACVIGVKHVKWDERPLLFVVPHPPLTHKQSADHPEPQVSEQELTLKESIQEFLATKVAKWWLPDDILFVNELPHTATGKLQKRTLRDQYWEYLIQQK